MLYFFFQIFAKYSYFDDFTLKLYMQLYICCNEMEEKVRRKEFLEEDNNNNGQVCIHNGQCTLN